MQPIENNSLSPQDLKSAAIEQFVHAGKPKTGKTRK
jgi:hypothetical protein